MLPSICRIRISVNTLKIQVSVNTPNVLGYLQIF